jgi:hypothetical protein
VEAVAEAARRRVLVVAHAQADRRLDPVLAAGVEARARARGVVDVHRDHRAALEEVGGEARAHAGRYFSSTSRSVWFGPPRLTTDAPRRSDGVAS